MRNDFEVKPASRYQPVITVLTVIALITSGWIIGSRAGGLLVSSAAEVPAPPERTRTDEVGAEPDVDAGRGVVPDPATLNESMAQTEMADADSEGTVDGAAGAEEQATAEDVMASNADADDGAVSDQIEAGEVAAELQCRQIEAEIALRWEDGRMTNADYDSRWEGFLTDEEYETILMPTLGASGDIASASERPLFEGFSDQFVVERLDNSELITGGDNCWELELYDFE